MVVFYFSFATLILATRWIFLPQVNQYRNDIAQLLAQATKTEVTIGAIEPRWNGFWPELLLQDVELRKPGTVAGTPSLKLPKLAASFNWKSVLGTVSFHSLAVSNAHLSVRRLSENVFEIGGVPLKIDGGSTRSDQPVGAALIDWLMHQNRIDILSSSIAYTDATHAQPKTVQLSHMNLSFYKGLTDWRFGLQAHIGTTKINPIDIRARLSTPLFFASSDWKTWNGTVYANVSDINFAQLLAATLPSMPLREGIGGGELTFDFQSGRMTTLAAQLQLATLDLRFTPKLQPLRLSHVSTQLHHRFNGKQLDVTLLNTHYRINREAPIDLPQLRIQAQIDEQTQSIERASIQAGSIDLNLLRPWLPTLPIPKTIEELIVTHDPKGQLRQSELTWQGPVSAPVAWSFSTHFSGLCVNPVPNAAKPTLPGIPGFSQLSGFTSFTRTQGSVELDSRNATLSFPGIFPHPDIRLEQLQGRLDWTSENKQPLRVNARNLILVNQDIHATANGNWQAVGGKLGTLDVSAQANHVRAAGVWKYLPTILPEGTRRWFEGGLVAGTSQDARFSMQGPLHQFPWQKAGTRGHFMVDLNLKGGAIDYVPSFERNGAGQRLLAQTWPLLSDIDARVQFKGMRVEIDAKQARTLGVAINGARAVIPDLTAGHDIVLLTGGSAAAELSRMLPYLEKSPVGAILGNAFNNTTAAGQGQLTLDLSIPLAHARDTQAKGSLTLTDAAVTMPWPVPPVEQLNGQIDFSNQGASAARLVGKTLGGQAVASVQTDEHGTVSIVANGTTDPQQLLFFNDQPLLRQALSKLSGQTPVVATVEIKKGHGVTVTAQSNLQGLSSRYAAPMVKTPEQIWPTQFSFTPVQVKQHKGYLLNLNIAQKFQTVLQLPQPNSRLPLTGAVSIGTSAQLPARGLHLDIALDRARLSDWTDDIDALTKAAQKLGSETPAALTPALNRVTLNARALEVNQMPFSNVAVQAQLKAPLSWQVDLQADQMQGKLLWKFPQSQPSTVQASFSRLHLPEKSEQDLEHLFTDQDHDNFPSITADITDFRLGSKVIGSVALRSRSRQENTHRIWTIDSLKIDNPFARLSASGEWRQKETSESTTLKASLDLSDGGKLLESLGYKGIAQGGSGLITTDLQWSGEPWAPRRETLQGSCTVALSRGSFSQIDTGTAGTFLSLVSMQSLLRRLSLDFADLTSKGVFFDSLNSSTAIQDGFAQTDSMKIASSHGSIVLSGNSDLVTESLNYNVVVFPNVNIGTASLALAFVNPAIGIGSFLAQLVLRNPLSRMFSVQYKVSGTFDAPVIEKISRTENDTGQSK